MELRSLLHILVARWWIVLPTLVITVGTAAVLALSQRPAYEASTTLIVTPAADVADETLSAIAVISRQTEITDTYAQIAASRLIARTAAEQLGLTGDERRDVRVTSRLIPGTTLVSITGRASDPDLASDYANAVSDALVAFVDDRYDVFDVSLVDVASAPDDPVAPNVPLTVAVGVIAGLALGVGLAIASAVVFRPLARSGLGEIVDAETSSLNETFLIYRLRQEMSRTRRGASPLALAVLDVNHRDVLADLSPRTRGEALRRMVALIDGLVRPEDVVCRLEGYRFAILMPDTSDDQAIAMLQAMRARLAAPALASSNGVPVHANPAAGVVEYRDGNTTETQLMQRAMVALSAAGAGPIGRTESFSSVSASQLG
jgi:diguanylate cyclase (GGDEF)-like protein